jgi:hypothetical protein
MPNGLCGSWQEEQITVIRVKNRMTEDYQKMKSCGYRDVLLNIRLRTELTQWLGLDLHVCELQLILKPFMLYKNKEGHKRYVEFRDKRGE